MKINSYPPVIEAIMAGELKKLKKLLDNGADPNEVYNGYPAIFHACDRTDDIVSYRRSCKIIQLLLKYNADTSLRAENGSMSVMKKLLHKKNCEFGFVKLILEHGYDVNETDENGVTLLMYASLSSRYYSESNPIAKLFVSHGADVNAADNMGRTALMWACGSALPEPDNTIGVKNLPLILYPRRFLSSVLFPSNCTGQIGIFL
jgi:ankyrin repeat protein